MECDKVSIEQELAEMREYVERKRRKFEDQPDWNKLWYDTSKE